MACLSLSLSVTLSACLYLFASSVAGWLSNLPIPADIPTTVLPGFIMGCVYLTPGTVCRRDVHFYPQIQGP